MEPSCTPFLPIYVQYTNSGDTFKSWNRAMCLDARTLCLGRHPDVHILGALHAASVLLQALGLWRGPLQALPLLTGAAHARAATEWHVWHFDPNYGGQRAGFPDHAKVGQSGPLSKLWDNSDVSTLIKYESCHLQIWNAEICVIS